MVAHCIGYIRSCNRTCLSNPIANKLYSIIYIFHMPLFVFISGYYANVKNKEKLISKGFMLLETFLVVMIPQCFYYGSIILY